MARGAQLSWLVVLALGACAEDVVLGRYLDAPALDGGPSVADGGGGAPDAGGDAGSDSGVASDAGSDAGLDSGVASDAGSDAGLDSGLAADAGSDAGLDSGLAADAGADGGAGLDGGAADAGAGLDAGPNLGLTLSGPWVVPLDAGALSWRLDATNAGTVGVSAATVALTFSPVLTVTAPGCVDAGPRPDGGPALSCALGALAPGASVGVPLTVTIVTNTQGLFAVEAQVPAAPGELALADNVARQLVGQTPVGVGPIAVGPPRLMDVALCAGTNIFSFAQCVPGSRLFEVFVLQPDGGFRDLDGGMLSESGLWGLSADGASILFTGPAPQPPTPYGYVGASVSATCYEGVLQAGTGRPYAGGWRGCLR